MLIKAASHVATWNTADCSPNWNLPFSVTMEPCSLATDRYCCHGFQFMQKSTEKRRSTLPLAATQCCRRSHLSNTETLTFAAYFDLHFHLCHHCYLCFAINKHFLQFLITLVEQQCSTYVILISFRNISWKENLHKIIIEHYLYDVSESECKHVALGAELIERAQQTIWRNSQNWWGWSLFSHFTLFWGTLTFPLPEQRKNKTSSQASELR